MTNILRQFISLQLNEAGSSVEVDVDAIEKGLKGFLAKDIVNLLVKRYARRAGLKWKFIDFPTELGKYIDTSKIHEQEDSDGTVGMYYDGTLFINKAMTEDDFDRQVETVLHEICHYNQDIDWEQGDKKQIVKGKRLPPGFTEDNLDDLSIDELHIFWESPPEDGGYGYWAAPQERHARLFAASKKRDAISQVIKMEVGSLESAADLEDARLKFEILNAMSPDELGQFKSRGLEAFLKKQGKSTDEIKSIVGDESQAEKIMTSPSFKKFLDKRLMKILRPRSK